MDSRIREALNTIIRAADDLSDSPKSLRLAVVRLAREALALLDAPVAGDALELALELAAGMWEPDTLYVGARNKWLTNAAPTIESFAADRERKAREECEKLRGGGVRHSQDVQGGKEMKVLAEIKYQVEETPGLDEVLSRTLVNISQFVERHRRVPPMSDTKHTPEIDGDARAVFDCLKYHASAGGEYEYRGTLAIEAFTRMCGEIAALRAAAEKAREALERIESVVDIMAMLTPGGIQKDSPAHQVKSALAALEEVLK